MTSPIERLRQLLLGEWFAEVGYSDEWQLRTGDESIWLLAQRLVTSTDARVRSALERAEPKLLSSVDRSVVETAAGVFGLLRRPITAVEIDGAGGLAISFEGDRSLTACTDVPIVDWQWSVSTQNVGPYTQHEVACLWRPDVVLTARKP
jgi:hypothetical protein